MSCVFIRPVLPHGYLPSTNLLYPLATNYDSCSTWTTSDIVDGDQLQKNWAILLSKINGALDGTDFLETSSQFAEETALVDYEGGVTGTWPTVGQRHSHDGIDSAKLADHVLPQAALGVGATSWGSFGMLRHPSETFHGILETFWVAYDQPSPSKGLAYSATVAVPHNSQRWGSYLQRSGVNGRMALLTAPLMSGYNGWTQNQKCAPSMLAGAFTGGAIPSTVSARMQDLMGERVASSWSYGVMVLACIKI